MRFKKSTLSKVSILTIMCLTFMFCMAIASFAGKAEIVPEVVGTNVQKTDFSIPPLVNESEFSTTKKISNSTVTSALTTSAATGSSLIAVLTVFF